MILQETRNKSIELIKGYYETMVWGDNIEITHTENETLEIELYFTKKPHLTYEIELGKTKYSVSTTDDKSKVYTIYVNEKYTKGWVNKVLTLDLKKYSIINLK